MRAGGVRPTRGEEGGREAERKMPSHVATLSTPTPSSRCVGGRGVVHSATLTPVLGWRSLVPRRRPTSRSIRSRILTASSSRRGASRRQRQQLPSSSLLLSSTSLPSPSRSTRTKDHYRGVAVQRVRERR